MCKACCNPKNRYAPCQDDSLKQRGANAIFSIEWTVDMAVPVYVCMPQAVKHVYSNTGCSLAAHQVFMLLPARMHGAALDTALVFKTLLLINDLSGCFT